MDLFDDLNQTAQGTDQTREENDLFGSDLTTNTTTAAAAAASRNPFDSLQQPQVDNSWVIDDVLTDTTSQKNLFDDDTLSNLTSAPQAAAATSSFDEDLFSDQPNTDRFEASYLPPTSDDLLNDDAERQPSGNNLSFDRFNNSTSAPSITMSVRSAFSTPDPLQAFNARRQQELAEMEVVEKQKIDEMRKQGKLELERWYEDRHRQMEQKRQTIKDAQTDTINQSLEKSTKETCDWAKVIRYLDFSQGTQLTKQKRDINRMRAVIVQAKRDKDARTSENGV